MTFGRDYFPTRDPSYVSQTFATLSDADGIQYHDAAQGHMPGLGNEDLVRIVTDTVDTRRYTATRLVPSALVIESAVGADSVMLRERPTEARVWSRASNAEARLENGARVQITDEPRTDEQGYEMVHVRHTANQEVHGWIYTRNIPALR